MPSLEAPPLAPTDSEGRVVLPMSSDQFRSFVSDLLGRPEVGRKFIRGSFTIDVPGLVDIYHLLTQRVAQQNNAHLAGFTCMLIFRDGSSAQLSGIDSLTTYNEIRPLVCVGAVMSWDFLVRFNNQPAPQRQRVDVSFSGEHGHSSFDGDAPLFISHGFSRGDGNVMGVVVRHTARSWSADIENLLSNKLETYLVPRSAVFQRAKALQGVGAFGVAVVSFLACLATSLWGLRVFAEQRRAAFQSGFAALGDDPQALGAKIQYLGDIIVAGHWPTALYYTAIFLVLAVVAAFIFGLTLGTSNAFEEKSYILVTDATRKERDLDLVSANSSMKWFIASGVVAVMWNLVSSVLFLWLCGK